MVSATWTRDMVSRQCGGGSERATWGHLQRVDLVAALLAEQHVERADDVLAGTRGKRLHHRAWHRARVGVLLVPFHSAVICDC